MKNFFTNMMEESTEFGMYVRSLKKQGFCFSVHVDDPKKGGKKKNMAHLWESLMKNEDIDEPTSFLNHVYLGCSQRDCKPNEKKK